MSLSSVLATVQNASISSTAVTIIAILIIRLVLRALYRITLHPLAKFPGPKLHAATRLPILTAINNGTIVEHVVDLHKRYGPIVRVMPDEISVIEPQAWKDVHGYQRQTDHPIPVKHPLRYSKPANGADSIIRANDEDHQRLRRIFAPAFSDRALKAQEPLFRKYVDLLIQKLKEGIAQDPERKFDIVRAYNFTTFDIMADLTFGESLNMLENSEYDPWVSIVFNSIKMGTRVNIIKNYPLLNAILMAVLGKKMQEKRDAHFQYSVDRVTKRLQKGGDQHDIWNLVLSQKEGGKVLSRPEMDSHSSLFMIAGTETTATLLSGLTYLLLTNPDKMDKLVKEISGAFETKEDMSMEALARLPYLHGCTEEALRLYPPVATGLPRWTGNQGTTVAGHYIPPKTTITVAQYAMFTSPSNFTNPLSFIPERWIETDNPIYAADKRSTLQPFSYGPRNCVGKNMAYHEMRLILANVLWHFDLEFCEESKDWIRHGNWILWEKPALMVKLREVERR